jgi:hypothetical protein
MEHPVPSCIVNKRKALNLLVGYVIVEVEQQRKAGLGHDYMSRFGGEYGSAKHALPRCGSISSTP